MYTYRIETTNIFGEILFGASRTNGYSDWVKAINANDGTIVAAAVQHPFMEMDYVLTHYSNPVTFAS
jgi:hypothetical protein